MKHNFHRVMILLTALCLVFLTACSQAKENAIASATNITTEEPNPLKLSEVIDLANQYLEDNELDASGDTLISAISQDVSETYSGQGDNGSRSRWNLDYKKKSDSNTCYVIQISAGEVINCLEDGSDDVTTVDTSSIIDSDEAQKIAADYGLEPGESWPIGYDFQLEVNTFGDDEKEYTMLTVYGQHEDCSFAKVILNANTGEILRASQKVQNEDGSGDWITW